MPAAARRCPACDSRTATPAFEVAGFAHLQCGGCRTLFVSPMPDDGAIRAVYEQPDYHADVESSAPRMRAEARARASVFQERGCTSLLEIGCGAGYFLEACGELGIHAEGVDAGPTGARARQRGLIVHDTWVDEFKPGRVYDAIALWEVIEHLPRPTPVMKRLRSFVKPGGVLALSTPSWSGIPARVLRQRFPMITPPEHLTLFTRRGLNTVLTDAGFQPFRWTSFSGLDPDTLARNFQRYFLGQTKVGSAVARVLATATNLPMRVVDHVGMGTSFELYATAV